MIPDEDDAAEQRETDWREDPVRELAPMHTLHFMETPRIDKLPGSEYVYFVCPDRADVIEAEREIKEKKDVWVHD